MTTQTTLEQIVNQHRDVIAQITEAPASDTPERFVDQVEDAANFLSASPAFASETDELETAHRYLIDALNTEDPAARAVLAGKAGEHLNMLDPTDFL